MAGAQKGTPPYVVIRRASSEERRLSNDRTRSPLKCLPDKPAPYATRDLATLITNFGLPLSSGVPLARAEGACAEPSEAEGRVVRTRRLPSPRADADAEARHIRFHSELESEK